MRISIISATEHTLPKQCATYMSCLEQSVSNQICLELMSCSMWSVLHKNVSNNKTFAQQMCGNQSHVLLQANHTSFQSRSGRRVNAALAAQTEPNKPARRLRNARASCHLLSLSVPLTPLICASHPSPSHLSHVPVAFVTRCFPLSPHSLPRPPPWPQGGCQKAKLSVTKAKQWPQDTSTTPAFIITLKSHNVA